MCPDITKPAMKHSPLILLCLLGAACATPAPPVDPAEVQSFLDEFRATAAGGDADGIAAHYTEDVRILEDGRVAYQGRDEVRDAIAAFPVTGGTSLDFSDTEITPVGSDGALVQTMFSQTYGSEGYSFSGAISLLVVRQDGVWQIHRSHTSTARAEGEGWSGEEGS